LHEGAEEEPKLREIRGILHITGGFACEDGKLLMSARGKMEK
jgi:hypothetical protein